MAEEKASFYNNETIYPILSNIDSSIVESVINNSSINTPDSKSTIINLKVPIADSTNGQGGSLFNIINNNNKNNNNSHDSDPLRPVIRVCLFFLGGVISGVGIKLYTKGTLTSIISSYFVIQSLNTLGLIEIKWDKIYSKLEENKEIIQTRLNQLEHLVEEVEPGLLNNNSNHNNNNSVSQSISETFERTVSLISHVIRHHLQTPPGIGFAAGFLLSLWKF